MTKDYLLFWMCLVTPSFNLQFMHVCDHVNCVCQMQGGSQAKPDLHQCRQTPHYHPNASKCHHDALDAAFLFMATDYRQCKQVLDE